MITLNTFFEPKTTRQRVIKWTAICLVLCLGLGLLLVNLPDLIACNEVCQEPIYVDATVSVRRGYSYYYDEYLSYEYENTVYKDIYYRTVKSWIANEQGTTIMIAINPNNPAQLVEHMVQEYFLILAIVVFVISLATFIYGIAIEHDFFRKWRISKASRKYSRATEPDYLLDMFLLSVAILTVTMIAMFLLFPYVYPPGPAILLLAIVGITVSALSLVSRAKQPR